ncbi:glycosyl transferase family 90 [Psychromonas aquatilis]|uniref:Glycosyl transferase family 90 n=1 Tax=Psychromonas aquatilis TaxID=2005072 RepID=A0ABU9GL53_9GAMM
MNNKNQIKRFSYYFFNALGLFVPNVIFRRLLKRNLNKLSCENQGYIKSRVDYYNKLSVVNLDIKFEHCVASYKKTKGTTYYFDMRNVIKYFPSSFKFSMIAGDVTCIPNSPSFVKSRPINGHNENSVLLKLNKIRHFNFIKDEIPYKDKKNMSVWRGVGYQPHRVQVLKQFYAHKMCNIGQTKPYRGNPWEKEFMCINEQLQYKFLLCIEGNDVATNLKWVMSSNSLCMMSKPKFETWFMEGRLEAGVHYVELKGDYSDLIEKMNYYLANEDKALQIINNANQYVEQFKDEKREKLIELLVAQKYFERSGQL